MLKAILYYILLIAEFMITIFLGGFIMGLYVAFCAQKGGIGNEQAFMEEAFPFVVGISLLSMLIVWGTFHYYKFSKFSLGNVIPAQKWKAMLYTSLPMMSFSLFTYSAMNYFHLDFLPKEMEGMEGMNGIYFLPFAIIGSFYSAYVFFGAIHEELIRCGKKKWVQLLTLTIMILPATLMSATAKGDINVNLTLMGVVCTIYAFWVYGKTRSTIILFTVYLLSNVIPFKIEPAPLALALMIIGLIIGCGSLVILRKNLPSLLKEEEEEGKEN